MTTIDQSSEVTSRGGIHGYASEGFEAVREAFAANFSHRKELGAACCVYHHGEKVVDLWGGVRNKATGEPWEEDTMALVFSATKGFAAMVMALAHSRGLLDYEERVCTYWPEFAQNGKENVTVRQLLAHQAALFAFNERVDKSVIADLDRLAVGVGARRIRNGSPGPARPTTPSPWASMKASCCAGSIRSIAASGSSSRTRSPRRSLRTSTSGFRRRSPTPSSRQSSPRTRWR